MKTILKITLLALALNSISAFARPAQCLLVVDGVTYLNGVCNFSPNDHEGSFSIGAAGKAGEKISKYFAYVSIETDGTVDGYWNGKEQDQNASEQLGKLQRNGACRFNDRAIICAWALN